MTPVPSGVTTSDVRSRRDRGFTLVELLVTMAITTIIMGATMAAMNDAIKATESAKLITGMNNGLRTAMDLMVRDILQVGQGLPAGRVVLVPSGANSAPMQLPGPIGSSFQLDGPSFCPEPTFVCTQITAVVPGPGRGPEVVAGRPTDMLTIVGADTAFDQVPLNAFAVERRQRYRGAARFDVAEFPARNQHHQRRRRRPQSGRSADAGARQRQHARAGHHASSTSRCSSPTAIRWG